MSGVLQGSNVGPLLFMLKMCDIVKPSDTLNLILYAGDANLNSILNCVSNGVISHYIYLFFICSVFYLIYRYCRSLIHKNQ